MYRSRVFYIFVYLVISYYFAIKRAQVHKDSVSINVVFDGLINIKNLKSLCWMMKQLIGDSLIYIHSTYCGKLTNHNNLLYNCEDPPHFLRFVMIIVSMNLWSRVPEIDVLRITMRWKIHFYNYFYWKYNIMYYHYFIFIVAV